MECSGDAADNDEIHAGIAKQLHRTFELHQERLRATPRTPSIALDAASNLCARWAGERRNCSISSVMSMPYFCAASMRLPGTG